jgi:predicted O-methyltransferase YrrM
LTEEEKKKLIQKYGVEFRNYNYDQLRNMMFILPIAIKAKTIVETGLHMGHSTRIFLKALQFTDGHLYTYDYKDYPETREAIEKEGFNMNRWTFRLMDAVEGGKQWKDGAINLLYLDDHKIKTHVIEELNVWSQHLTPNAIILIHDTMHKDPTAQGLMAAEEWIKKSGWKLVNINEPEGMAVLFNV